MLKSELIAALNDPALPDVEVGTAEGFIIGAEVSSYDDDSGVHPYIHLDDSGE
jgi:hypothetical protein